MIESIFNSSATVSQLTMSQALLTFAVAILLGGMISWTYMKTQTSPSPSFTLTMTILPVIVAVIILLIGSNIARAFSLAGAFSIIRFRSAPGDSKDISYVLFSMASGLACGVGAYGYAALFTVLLCALMFILRAVKFGVSKESMKTLKVTIPESLGYEEAFDDIFRKFNIDYELKKVRTTELGSLYEVIYAVKLGPNTDQKELLDAVRTRNGNLDITLTMNPALQE
ncbi:DUF4956 domain-containing protein [Paenibacillus doosanensis]|uniref:DUF4956 domain-containing protein n=1 Tax=Paenibacillus konkukensis TaxID=2020716 RepID=A0ABY4RH20_9BACL|nr:MULTISPECIES: DUF4956 domain-containing protein [Paenibacillus]MCS7462270.1 DUF4956 domain-containing protein [Paenibacillus doosanensis]UQZ80924.1 hypothetical protein SK3146_00080 [Paenibacillus konkukensis]